MPEPGLGRVPASILSASSDLACFGRASAMTASSADRNSLPGMETRAPNLLVQTSSLPLPGTSAPRVKMNDPPSVWLPPLAFQYMSACRGSDL